MTYDEANVGMSLTFIPSPRGGEEITAKVVSKADGWITTVDAAGKERKVRPSRARAA